MAQLSDPRMRGALYYARKRRLARIAAANATPTDPHFASVSFLSGFEGAEGASVFADESSNNVSITNFGTPQTLAAAKKFGDTGLAVNEGGGTTEYLNLGSPAVAGCNFGTGDFTIEGFGQSTINDGTWFHSILGNFLSADTGSFSVFVKNNPINSLHWTVAGQTGQSATTDLGTSQFHFAVSRNVDNLRLFVNGVMEKKVTGYTAISVGGTTDLIIGGNNQGNNDRWNGYADEIRITKGVGRYNSDVSFAVPTVAYPRS